MSKPTDTVSTSEAKAGVEDKIRPTTHQVPMTVMASSDLTHEADRPAETTVATGSRQSVKEGLTLESPIGTESSDAAQFKKDLNFLGVLSAGYNSTNAWLIVAVTMTVSLSFGPTITVAGVLISMPIYICIGLTLAELISAYPTTGGQYHWTSILAPAGIRRGMSYIVGFISWFSWITLAAASCGSISLCSNALIFHTNPNFVPTPWQGFLFYQAMLVVSIILNVFGKRVLSVYYSFTFILSLVAFVVFTVTTLAMADKWQSSSVIWNSYSKVSGWSPGLQVLIGLSSPVVAFSPLDTVVHLVEEVKDAPRVVPRTVLAAIGIAFITLIPFVLAVLYSVTDLDAVLATPSGFPLYEVWRQATRTDAVPIVFTTVCIVLLPAGTIVTCQVASMMTWSLAVDGGLPFRKHMSKVHAGLNAPLWSLGLVSIIMFLIGCIYLFSSLAFNSIVGVAGVLQQLTFCAPSVLLLWHHRSPEVLSPTRSFRLPSWVGWLANIVTVMFTFITTSFLLLPASPNPRASSMNYACVVAGGAILLGLVNWIFYARKQFNGPVSITFHH